MKLVGWLSENRRSGGSEEFVLRALNTRLPKATLAALLGRGSELDSTSYPPLAFGFTSALRGLVDLWIDSGRSDSEDSPWERTIQLDHLRLYVARHPPILNASGPDGALHLLMGPPHSRRPDMSTIPAMTGAVVDVATALFLQLLDSPVRFRLSRCDECRKYFLRTRNPKKNMPIFHGVFCDKHKGSGARRRTVKSRSDRTQELVTLAAEFWQSWRPSPRYGEQSKWIAMKMTKQRALTSSGRALLSKFRTGQITGKWVNTHKPEIEAEVRRRTDAKGKDSEPQIRHSKTVPDSPMRGRDDSGSVGTCARSVTPGRE